MTNRIIVRIPFPFAERAAPRFETHYHWTREQLLGYLGTWSAIKHFREETGNNPLIAFEQSLPEFEATGIIFPPLLRIGYINTVP